MHIQLKNTKNTRSLSDLANQNGLHIKPHLLIRSDALNHIDEEDQRVLRTKYNLKRVIDLRCDNEIQGSPDIDMMGVQLILNPILPSNRVGVTKKGNDEEDFHNFIEAIYKNGAASSVQFMSKVYKEIVSSEFSTTAYQRFIKLLLEDVSGSTLWHCSAGKDRAGFATILILYLLDFSKEVIEFDYLSTNSFYQSNIEIFVQRYGEEYRDVITTVFGVRSEYLDIIWDTIQNLYGSFDAYVTNALKITQSDIQKLKDIYLEEK